MRMASCPWGSTQQGAGQHTLQTEEQEAGHITDGAKSTLAATGPAACVPDQADLAYAYALNVLAWHARIVPFLA